MKNLLGFVFLLLVVVPGTVMADEIDQRCRAEWGNNSRMVRHCTKTQRQAKREISAFSGLIRNNCENEWGSNYKMVLHCINNQSEALSNLDRMPNDHITLNCKNEWGNNFRMVEYCIKQQRSSKRTIEQSYSNSNKRNQCEREWGNNYRMVLYCIRK